MVNLGWAYWYIFQTIVFINSPMATSDIDPFNSMIKANIIAGRFDPALDSGFVSFVPAWSSKKMYLRKEVFEAFLLMADSASKEGIPLFIVSATRTFDHQKELWENKWVGKTMVDGKNLRLDIKNPQHRARKILEYTAPPGYSRHHWGTDIDLNSVEPAYFDTEQGQKVYDWLLNHAGHFGFCQTYPAQGEKRSGGFNEEKWHWSYLPVSKTIWEAQIQQFSTRKKYRYKGYQAVNAINIIDYLLLVNHCD